MTSPWAVGPGPSAEELGFWLQLGKPSFGVCGDCRSFRTGGGASTRDPASHRAPAVGLPRPSQEDAPADPQGALLFPTFQPQGRRRALLPAGALEYLKAARRGQRSSVRRAAAAAHRGARRGGEEREEGAWSRRGPAEHRSAGGRRHGERGPGQPASPLRKGRLPGTRARRAPGWRLLSPADPPAPPAVWVLRAAPRGRLRAAASPGFPAAVPVALSPLTPPPFLHPLLLQPLLPSSLAAPVL